MQHDEFPVHRLVDGNIDYDFYRAQAARLREQTLQGFWQEIGRWWWAAECVEHPARPLGAGSLRFWNNSLGEQSYPRSADIAIWLAIIVDARKK